MRFLISDGFLPQNSFFLKEVMSIMVIKKELRKSSHLLSSCHAEELSPKVETQIISSFRNNTENRIESVHIISILLGQNYLVMPYLLHHEEIVTLEWQIRLAIGLPRLE